MTSNEEEEEDGLEHTYERLRWLDIRDEVRPTQVALGWDWTFYKLSNFKDFESAKAYMERIQNGNKHQDLEDLEEILLLLVLNMMKKMMFLCHQNHFVIGL